MYKFSPSNIFIGMAIAKYLILSVLAYGVTSFIRTFSFHAIVGRSSPRMLAVTITVEDCSSVHCLVNAVEGRRRFSGTKLQFVRCCSKKNPTNNMKIWELKIKNRERIQKKQVKKPTQARKGQLIRTSPDGKKFGDHCSDNHDCGYQFGWCLRGACSCNIGYSYDFGKHECVTSCSKYGTSFSKYDNSSVGHCNIRYILTSSSQYCMERCRDETDFVCINVEFGGRTIIPECNMCNETWNNIKSEDRENGTRPEYVLYYRHCQN